MTGTLGTTRDSPRAWGWTEASFPGRHRDRGFPTCVGVDRKSKSGPAGRTRIPHVRGGGPQVAPMLAVVWEDSPRPWGWTVQILAQDTQHGGFPTCVGVHRRRRAVASWRSGIPHVRGGWDGPGGCRQNKSPQL